MGQYRHILRQRIKDMGYTQQEFADKVGIPYETLKNILRGSGKYTVDMLETFSKALDCSYDFLMGYTKTPKRKLQTVKDKIAFSDDTINFLQNLSSQEDEENKKAILKTLDALILDDNFLIYASSYLYKQEDYSFIEDSIYSMLEEHPNFERPPYTIGDALVTAILSSLINIKNRIPK